jgi:hypothetical protein
MEGDTPMSVLAPRFGFGIGLGKGYGARSQGGGLTPIGPSYAFVTAGAAPGTLIASIMGLSSGENIALVTPNDGRFALDSSRRNLIVGMSAITAGTVVATLTTSTNRVLALTINAQPSLPAPLLLEGFNSLAGWTAESVNLELSLDNVAPVEGGSLLRLQAKADGTGEVRATKASIGTINPANLGTMLIYARFDDDPDYQRYNNFNAYFRKGATSYFKAVSSGLSASFTSGGRWFSMEASTFNNSFTSAGSAEYGLQIMLTEAQSGGAKISLDAFVAKGEGRPAIILTLDDIPVTQFNNARPLLNDRGLKGTFFIPTANIAATDRMTVEQLATLYADGHDLASNGTPDDTAMTSRPTLEAAIADIKAVRAFLIANGWTRAVDHLCYPNGSTRTPGTEVTTTAATSTGNDVVTMTSTAGVTAGMKVVGYNVPRITRVVSVDSVTQITVDHNIPAQTKPMTFVNDSGHFHTGKMQAALKAAGFKSGRTTVATGSFPSRFGVGDQALYCIGNPTSGRTFAQLQTTTDAAIRRGETLMFYTHGVFSGAAGQHTDVAVFTEFLDYLKAKSDAGEIDVLTVSQWWARDCSNPKSPF